MLLASLEFTRSHEHRRMNRVEPELSSRSYLGTVSADVRVWLKLPTKFVFVLFLMTPLPSHIPSTCPVTTVVT